MTDTANQPESFVERLKAALAESNAHDGHTEWCAFMRQHLPGQADCDCGYAQRYLTVLELLGGTPK